MIQNEFRSFLNLSPWRCCSCSPACSYVRIARTNREPIIEDLKRKQHYPSTNRTLKAPFDADVGAVVSYRFKDQSSAPHQFKFEQFFSPGIHIAKGINGTPLVASFSMVYTPLLRRVGDDPRQKSVVRAQVGLLFDIPLGKIYSYDVYRLIDKLLWMITLKSGVG